MISMCFIEYYERNAEIVSLCNNTYKALDSLVFIVLYGVPVLF